MCNEHVNWGSLKVTCCDLMISKTKQIEATEIKIKYHQQRNEIDPRKLMKYRQRRNEIDPQETNEMSPRKKWNRHQGTNEIEMKYTKKKMK